MEGSNGEYVYLSWEERVELVRRVKRLAAPGKLIIAGSGCECESHASSVVLVCCSDVSGSVQRWVSAVVQTNARENGQDSV